MSHRSNRTPSYSSARPETGLSRKSSPRSMRWCIGARCRFRSSAWRAPDGILRSCANARARAWSMPASSSRNASRSCRRSCAMSTAIMPIPRRITSCARNWVWRRVRSTTLPFPRACSRAWSKGLPNPAARTMRESSWRSRSAATWRRRRRSTRRCTRYFPRNRSFASIITSARRRCKICSIFASPIRFSSRYGIANTSRTCRSRWPSRSAWRDAAASTKKSAQFATWCKIICCR